MFVYGTYCLDRDLSEVVWKERLLAGANHGGREEIGQNLNVPIDDPVRFSGPFGDFAIKPGEREKVFIGGGAGMAPLRAIIHSRLDNGGRERIHFWYGARILREAPYVEEMAALAQQHPNFSWHLVLSEEAEHGAGLMKGLVHEVTHDALLREHPDIHACDFYLCGPPAMLSATRRLLRGIGVAEECVSIDDFKI